MKPVAGKIYMFDRGIRAECYQLWSRRVGGRTFAAFRIVTSSDAEHPVGYAFSLMLDRQARLPRWAGHSLIGRPRQIRRPKIGLRVTKQIMKECQ